MNNDREKASIGIQKELVGRKYTRPEFAGWAHRVFDVKCKTSNSRQASIFLGPWDAAKKSPEVRQSIKDHNVTAIVNCSQDLPCEHSDVVEYCQVPVTDTIGADILSYLWGATAFIDEHVNGKFQKKIYQSDSSSEVVRNEIPKGGSVLVHCQMGRSRSTTVVIAYLIRFQGMSREGAMLEVKSRRRMAKPNLGFWEQLADFEIAVRKGNSDVTIPLQQPGIKMNFMEWTKRSSARYSTIGSNAVLKMGRETLEQRIFGEIMELEMNESDHIQMILNSAMSYIWARGLIKSDLEWLRFLLTFLQRQIDQTKQICVHVGKEESCEEKIQVKELVLAMLREGSAFSSSWAGEIYPFQIKRIHALFTQGSLTLITKE